MSAGDQRATLSPTRPGRCRGAWALAATVLLAGVGLDVQAATPLNEIRFTPDVTATLGAPAATVTPRQIGQSFGGTSIFTVSVGAMPEGTRVVAYHRRADGTQLFVVDVATSLGGALYTPRDVVQYDGAVYGKFFDGVAAGIPDGVRLNGVALVHNATLLLSFNTTVALSGVTFAPRDIAMWSNPTFSKVFDGAAAGLPDGTVLQDFERFNRSDINGRLLLNFDTAGTIGGVAYDRYDALEYTPGAPGTWEVSYHGSLHNWASADLTAVWAMPGAIAPTAVTQAATGVTTGGATLHGSVNDNGADTTITFEYGLTTAYGSVAAAAPSSLPMGSGDTAVLAITGALTCGQTYHYRINATNNQATTHGDDVTFAATCVPPTVVTDAASAPLPNGATLNGHVNDNGAATTVTFEYGLTTAYGSSVGATPGTVAAGAGNTAVSAAIGGLACNTPYHFRVNGNNGAGGTQNGSDLTFTTAACVPPTVVTDAASAPLPNGATLNGHVNDNGAATTVTFEYGLTTAYGSSVGATPGTVAAGAGNTAVSVAIGGLACNTPYHFRVNGNNGAGGTQNGSDLTFTTAACVPPTVVTDAASAPLPNGATLNGHVNDNGAATTVTFEYGLTTAYGSSVGATPGTVAAGAGNTAVSAAIGGLACNTPYHFRVNGNNGAGGTQNGSDLTFTTAACVPPTVVTDAASALLPNGATLNGHVNDNGAATTVTFEYGLTTAYGSSVGATPGTVAAGAGNTAVSAAIGGLACNTPYHFRVNGNNGAGGTQNGSDLTFTTAACVPPTVVTDAASALLPNGATLNGHVNDNGAATTVTFEYGLTTAYGSSVGATPGTVAAGAGNTAVSAAIGGLACNTPYHFRVTADNSVGGPQTGADLTLVSAPCVNTSAATAIPTLGHIALALLLLAMLLLGAGIARRR